MWCKRRRSEKVSSFCSISGTRGVTLVTKPVISHEWGKDQIVITTNRYHILWSSMLYACVFHKQYEIIYVFLFCFCFFVCLFFCLFVCLFFVFVFFPYLLTATEYLFVVITIWSFPHSWQNKKTYIISYCLWNTQAYNIELQSMWLIEYDLTTILVA
jgi:drug/metabolite transporter (DMT)-like permease